MLSANLGRLVGRSKQKTTKGGGCKEAEKEAVRNRETRGHSNSKWLPGNRLPGNKTPLRTVATFVTAHKFCASRETRVSYGWCLLIQGYFCAV